jgi:hypothetical protein
MKAMTGLISFWVGAQDIPYIFQKRLEVESSDFVGCRPSKTKTKVCCWNVNYRVTTSILQ